MSKVIEVKDLSKSFKISKEERVSNHKNSKEQIILNKISFSVNKGEKVAFIGPNGAGKSTTMKILTGIMAPNSGLVNVLGYIPSKERKKMAYHIGVVFGQTSQLWYQLPVIESYKLISKIYGIEVNFFEKQLKELSNLFEIKNLQYKPVHQLSLGQKMRCEIVASLLHNPKILFLDEPSIGLDLSSKIKLRNVLNNLVLHNNTTLFLTSHDTDDIEKIADRVIILDKGILVIDNSVIELRIRYKNKKNLTFVVDNKEIIKPIKGVIYNFLDEHTLNCEIDLKIISIGEVIQYISNISNLKDVTIENPSMEEIIKDIYEDLQKNK